MAIFHLSIKNISRGDGRSAVAAAAYRAGETLPNEAEERESDFGGKRDVIYSEICLPVGAPSWMMDRARLWNEAEKAEIRKDARLSKEIVVAIPVECRPAQWPGLIRSLARTYVEAGHVVDFAIHDDGTVHNPHAHLLLTTRRATDKGFGLKIRDADGKKFVLDARKTWAGIVNTTFTEMGLPITVDHRSHKAAGLDASPSTHRGPNPELRRTRRKQMTKSTIEEMRQQVRESDHFSERTLAPVIDHIARDAPLEVELQNAAERSDPFSHDDDHPVPDPDGNPIHPRELATAEERMLDDMHHTSEPEIGGASVDINAARAEIDRQNVFEMTEDEAAAYRLAPENMLDWLDDARAQEDAEDQRTLERWENHLDWLEAGDDRPSTTRDEGRWPEHDRR